MLVEDGPQTPRKVSRAHVTVGSDLGISIRTLKVTVTLNHWGNLNSCSNLENATHRQRGCISLLSLKAKASLISPQT